MELEVGLSSSREQLMSTTEDGVKDYGTASFTAQKRPLSGTEAAWYVFDNLTCEQAEEFLLQHGGSGTYLVAHFLEPESYRLSIKLMEGRKTTYKHYTITKNGTELRAESIEGTFSDLEEVIVAIGKKLRQKLTPIFNGQSKDKHEFSITLDADPPPDYTVAGKYPEAARKSLPIIVPIHPTLRRLGLSSRLEASGDLPLELTGTHATSTERSIDYSRKGCCWKAFHTDVDGKWYKPHKAGPITAVILVIGWIFFLVFFGWIVGLALLLVLVLICFAYIFNFMCTGRCRVEEVEESTNTQPPNTVRTPRT